MPLTLSLFWRLSDKFWMAKSVKFQIMIMFQTRGKFALRCSNVSDFRFWSFWPVMWTLFNDSKLWKTGLIYIELEAFFKCLASCLFHLLSYSLFLFLTSFFLSYSFPPFSLLSFASFPFFDMLKLVHLQFSGNCCKLNKISSLHLPLVIACRLIASIVDCPLGICRLHD